MSSIAYTLGNSLYLNITNRCSNSCTFCVRYKSDIFNKKNALWLEKEPSLEELKKEVPAPTKYKEIVFCGYGEPLTRLDIVTALSAYIREKGGRVRIDTNGQANLLHGRNVLPDLKGLVDSISISLNAQNAELYERLCHSDYGLEAYPAVLDFIKEAKKYIPNVTCTVLNMPKVIDIEACRKIAQEIGVDLRVREYYEEEYPELEKHIEK